MKQYVIIGNGVAAASCIEGIRSQDSDGKITVVSEEKWAVYCRPLISYYLQGKTDLERMNYRSPDFYEKMNCEVLYGKKAVQLDPAAKTVTLDDGTALPYTSVCVAAGSSPFVPPADGFDTVDRKFTFLTLDDTLALESAITPESKVLIVGAGLIGLKCAEGLQGRVGEITVCDLADRVLSSILDAECAAVMQKHLEAAGIRFLLGDSAASFQKNTAFMRSGKTVDFDVLVMAVGVRPNTALVKDAGGEVNRGIVVNTKMETSLPDVYSAGDCTEGDDISCGSRRILALLPNATQQGKCAGINMAGGCEVFDKAIPMNSIGFFGLHAMTAGSYFGPESGGEVYVDTADTPAADGHSDAGTPAAAHSGVRIKRLYTKDDRLTGFILIGDTTRAGIYTSLIREKTPLSGIDFELLKKTATSAVFSKEIRQKKFGGVV